MKKQMFITTLMITISFFLSGMDRENFYPPYCYQPQQQSTEQSSSEHNSRNYPEDSKNLTFYDLYLMNAQRKTPEPDQFSKRALTLSAELFGQRIEQAVINPATAPAVSSKPSCNVNTNNIRNSLVSSREVFFSE